MEFERWAQSWVQIQVEASNVDVELYWNNQKGVFKVRAGLLVIKVAYLRILF